MIDEYDLDIYYCDKCEEEIVQNDESVETTYGFICQRCAGH
jgi:formylmethanofuran dehydrogenase subunit E